MSFEAWHVGRLDSLHVYLLLQYPYYTLENVGDGFLFRDCSFFCIAQSHSTLPLSLNKIVAFAERVPSHLVSEFIFSIDSWELRLDLLERDEHNDVPAANTHEV